MAESKETDIEMQQRRPRLSALDTALPDPTYDGALRDPWFIFTARNPTDGADKGWAAKVNALDVFPYSRPQSVNTSVKGAFISIVALCIMMSVVITNIIVLANGNEDISMQTAARTNDDYQLPRFVVKSSGSLGRSPKSMNYSWFRVRFTQINDDKSDPKNRKKTLTEIPAEFCEFKEGNMKLSGWCAPTAKLYAQGEYADPLFRYVAAVVEPCWVYGGKNPGDLDVDGRPIVNPMPSLTCENETNIKKAFCFSESECDPSYGTFSLNVLDRKSMDYEKWSSPIYFNIEPKLWMGVEVFFQPTEGSRTGAWGTLGYHQHEKWMQFSDWYVRKVPHGVSNNLIKFYLRVSDSMEKQRYSQRGFSGMVEAVGSAWAMLTITLGLLARWYNSFKYVADPMRPREEKPLGAKEVKRAIVAHVDEMQNRDEMFDFWTAPVMTKLQPSKSCNEVNVPDASQPMPVKRTYICPICHVQQEIDGNSKNCVVCEGEIVAKVMDEETKLIKQTKLRSTADILFCFDTTGSMSQCIEEVRHHLEKTIDDLMDRIPSIRIGIIAHGDYSDEDSSYCLKSLSFSRNRQRIKEFLQSTGGTGGGDVEEECYELALHHAGQMEWRGNEKVFVLIGDSKPHEKDFEGFVKRKYKYYDWKVEAANLVERGIRIHAVQCLNRKEMTPFYQTLAHISKELGGKHLSLGKFIDMPDLFVAICMKHAASAKQYQQFQNEMAERMRGTGEQRYSWLKTLGILGATMFGAAAAGALESQM